MVIVWFELDTAMRYDTIPWHGVWDRDTLGMDSIFGVLQAVKRRSRQEAEDEES